MTTTGQAIDPNGVDHPHHYNNHPSGVECIEIIRHMTFDTGCVFKYLFRYTDKDGAKDLKKARWYMNDMIKSKVLLDHRLPTHVLNLLNRVFIAEQDPKLKVVWGAFLMYLKNPSPHRLQEVAQAVSRI